MLEAIFRIARLETSTYNKTSKLSAKNTAATRLSECASVIRLIVEVGVKKLRSKTVKALIDHIIQTLPTSNDSYCEPLISNYFKSLRTVLEYQPHPEHLPKDEWKNLVDFCNEAIHNMNILLNNNAPSLSIRSSNPGSFRDSPSRSGTPTPSNEHTSRASNGCSEKPVQVQLRQSAEDMVLCLFCLLSTPNAPVLDKTHASLTNLLELLASSFSNGLLQQAVFETINSIMAHIIINDICLTLQTLKYLLPLIWRLWDSKSATPKDSMLTSLIYGQAYFPRMMSPDETDDCRSHFLDLLEVFQKDYCKRPTRDQLQIEDINLPDHKLTYRSPSSIKAFRLRSGALKAEKPWALLYISASITIALCSNTVTIVNPDINDNIDHPIKRRKLNKPLDDLFKLTQSSQSPHKLFSLQVLAFIFDMHAMEPDDFQKYLDVLSPCLSDDNPSISSWAMLVLSRYLCSSYM